MKSSPYLSSAPKEAERYLTALLQNMEKRFPSNWRLKTPYNCLTLLDPRLVEILSFPCKDFMYSTTLL